MKRLFIFCLALFAYLFTGFQHHGIPKANAELISTASLLQGTKDVELISALYPTKCMDVQYGSTANQTPVQVWDCLGNVNQRFTIVPVNSTLVNIKFQGKCVDIQWGGSANGTPIWLYDCNGGYAQLWKPWGRGIFQNPNSNRCIDPANGANGRQLWIWDCNLTNIQNWQINRLPTIPGGGNISNLNYGINNLFPWIQSACGDMRIDSGFSNLQPTGQYAVTTGTGCGTPGLIFTGDGTPNFGQGQASTANQVVGGNTYPEVYSPGTNGLNTSYASILQKAATGNITVIDLATICTLSNCTLPANLAHGVYKANGDVNLNAYTFPANQSYVFLINGILTIKGNIITPRNVKSSTVFLSTGDMIVLPTVGIAAPATTANVSGIFSTDKSFIVQSANNCNDLKFNFEGTLIVNAASGGGSLQNLRNFCGTNPTSPTTQLTQRLDLVLNLPDFLKSQHTISKEAAP